MSDATVRSRPSLLVFSDDWGRHPSSCQHLIRHLLPDYQVSWVNTIGMRPPVFNRLTMVRGLAKLRAWIRPERGSATKELNPRVLNPKMWPWFTRSRDRWLNRVLLERQLASVVASSPTPVTAITTVPIVADLIGRLPVTRWVYYCVDDFSKWPGLDQATIGAMEEALVTRVDTLIAASQLLQQRLAVWNREAYLLTHGVDPEHWRGNGKPTATPLLGGVERPLVIFWGSIDWQMDLAFVRRLASDMHRGTIVLVGPTTDPDPALWTIPRILHVPSVPYDQLPSMAREATVLIMPYIDAPGLRESQPLKLKEYLASGKPAVVRDLPANRVWADSLDLACTPEQFSELVRRRLETGLPESQAAARQRLENESWGEKARQFERMMGCGVQGACGESLRDVR